MPSWFRRKPVVRPTLTSLRFDTTGWSDEGEQQPNHLHVWQTADGDAVALFFFDLAPNIPPCRTVDELRDFYGSSIKSAGAELVDFAVEPLVGQTAIRMTMKAPQQPHGRLYQATYTVPFRDFSFVVKIQCSEHGVTGVREAVLADRRMAAGEVPDVSGRGPFFHNWNPDAPEYDAQFPDHPVSRARRILARVAGSSSFDKTVAALPKFKFAGDG